jgi:hypothetical protein
MSLVAAAEWCASVVMVRNFGVMTYVSTLERIEWYIHSAQLFYWNVLRRAEETSCVCISDFDG